MFRIASSVKNNIYRCVEAGQHLHSPLAGVVDVSHSTILLELALDVPVSHVLVDPVHKEFAPLLRHYDGVCSLQEFILKFLLFLTDSTPGVWYQYFLILAALEIPKWGAEAQQWPRGAK